MADAPNRAESSKEQNDLGNMMSIAARMLAMQAAMVEFDMTPQDAWRLVMGDLVWPTRDAAAPGEDG